MRLFAAAALLAALPAHAAPLDQDLLQARDMTGLYQRLCLAAFPDATAIAATLKQAQATPLPTEQVQAALHGAPGTGWSVQTAVATYTIIIQPPPFQSCSVQRPTTAGLGTALPYIVALQDYARAKNLLMGEVDPLEHATEDGHEQILATPLTRGARRDPVETSMFITLDNPTTGVTVRMTHHLATP